MMIPSLRKSLKSASTSSYQVAIVGIETHICVTQTALDLLNEDHEVYILADGVSSCNDGERGIALTRLRKAVRVLEQSLACAPYCGGVMMRSELGSSNHMWIQMSTLNGKSQS